MSEETMDALDPQLIALGRSIDWPPTPDLRAGVRLAITSAPRPPRPFLGLRLTRPLLLALLLLALTVAVAAALVLGLPGLRIVTSDVLPSPNVPAVSPSRGAPVGAILDLGREVTRTEAETALGHPLLLPDLAGPDEPDAIYLERLRGVPVVTLVWGVRPDLPPATEGSDVGLLVTQFEAALDQGLLTKTIGTGSTVERVVVDRSLGVWISGRAHVIWFERPNGDAIASVIRLVGDTLAIDRDGWIVRLESALGKNASIALARTLR